jgi:Ser/Thr protein kinase RdoA (MazF antagonist)
MLFLDGAVTCVLDFDSAKIAPAVTDLANGALQFSIIAGSPDPSNWPENLDTQKFAAFIEGYCGLAPLSHAMLTAVPDLMIEILISEAVYPIAATGLFEHLCGFEFLQMISRKCRWIDQNRKLLHDDILGKE